MMDFDYRKENIILAYENELITFTEGLEMLRSLQRERDIGLTLENPIETEEEGA